MGIIKKQDLPFLLALLALLIVAGGLIFFFFGKGKNDVDLCRNIVTMLCEGRPAVERFIDWHNLNALGIDTGSTYKRLPNAREKTGYRRAFISNVSRGFSRLGKNAEMFSNWRLYKKEGRSSIVAADYKEKNKTILFTLFGHEKKKLTTIQWE